MDEEVQIDIEASRPEPDEELTLAKLLMNLESLGDNCEFGLVQRQAGAEPLGLLRFASPHVPIEVRLRTVVDALERQFSGLGSLDTVHLKLEGKPERREFLVHESAYQLLHHTFVHEGEVDPEEFRGKEARRLVFLRDKLLADLAAGEKLWVWKSNLPLSYDDIRPLLDVLRRLGPNSLLWVVLADPEHPPGTVERVEDDLLKGYVDRFAPYDDAPNISFESWYAVSRAAYAFWNNPKTHDQSRADREVGGTGGSLRVSGLEPVIVPSGAERRSAVGIEPVAPLANGGRGQDVRDTPLSQDANLEVKRPEPKAVIRCESPSETTYRVPTADLLEGHAMSGSADRDSDASATIPPSGIQVIELTRRVTRSPQRPPACDAGSAVSADLPATKVTVTGSPSTPLAACLRDAFARAMAGEGDLDPRALSIPGMSGRKFRLFLHNLIGSVDKARYLETGVFQGATFCSAIARKAVNATAIDNWSEYGGPANAFYKHLSEFWDPRASVTVLNRDFRQVEYGHIGKFNVHLFDGPHQYQDQYDGARLVIDALDVTAIFIVDDWNWEQVRSGTCSGLVDTGARIEFAIELRTTLDGSFPTVHSTKSDWHNGVFMGVIRKS